MKKEINLSRLLIKVFMPAIAVSLCYLIIGYFCSSIPHLLLFCILATVILLSSELGNILAASKSEYGAYSFKSAFVEYEEIHIWKIILIAFAFFCITGLLSVFVAPLENYLMGGLRSSLLQRLPDGFDWTNIEYVRTFSRPVLIITCIYYGLFNAFLAPITEELYFRGYLTSHYNKQSRFVPILISVLFSLYHFWLPFNNIFRILSFTPVYYITYRKKNIYIGIVFHCMCNLFSVVSFALEVLR